MVEGGGEGEGETTCWTAAEEGGITKGVDEDEAILWTEKEEGDREVDAVEGLTVEVKVEAILSIELHLEMQPLEVTPGKAMGLCHDMGRPMIGNNRIEKNKLLRMPASPVRMMRNPASGMSPTRPGIKATKFVASGIHTMAGRKAIPVLILWQTPFKATAIATLILLTSLSKIETPPSNESGNLNLLPPAIPPWQTPSVHRLHLQCPLNLHRKISNCNLCGA